MSDEASRMRAQEGAAILGRPLEPQADGELLEVLGFRLANEDYAVESRYVREVGALTQLTPLPCTPPFVLGVVNLRGEIVSVIDLRTFFELPLQGLSDLNRLIVLEGAGMRFGLLADAITGMARLALAELQPALPPLGGRRARYLRGVTRGRSALLDAGLLLADDSLVVRDAPGAASPGTELQGASE